MTQVHLVSYTDCLFIDVIFTTKESISKPPTKSYKSNPIKRYLSCLTL